MASIALDPNSQVLVYPVVYGEDEQGNAVVKRNDVPIRVSITDLAAAIAEINESGQETGS